MKPTREQLEAEANYWGYKLDKSVDEIPTTMDYSEMSDIELKKHIAEIRGQAKFNKWYLVVALAIVWVLVSVVIWVIKNLI